MCTNIKMCALTNLKNFESFCQETLILSFNLFCKLFFSNPASLILKYNFKWGFSAIRKVIAENEGF